MKLPFKIHDYTSVTECVSEILNLKASTETFVVGLPYVYTGKITMMGNGRLYKCHYHMGHGEERQFNHNRVDLAENYDFQFVNDCKIYAVKQCDWHINRVASFGYFSTEEPWNLEWNVNRFQRGAFPDDSDTENKFFRYISPVSGKLDFFRDFEFIIKNIGMWSYTLESIRVNVGGCEFSIYLAKVRDRTFFVVDNLTQTNLKNFDQCVTSILFALGFIEQKILLDESYTFVINHPRTGEGVSMRYMSLRESIFGQYAIFTTNAYSVRIPIGNLYGFNGMADIEMWSNKLSPCPKTVFDNLTALIYKYPILANCISILVDGSKAGLEIQGASFAVVLETITSLIEKEKLVPIHKVNPVVAKSKWKALRKEYLTLLSRTTLSEEEKEFVTNKLNNLNQPTNRDKLQTPFAAIGISLSQKEIDTIEQRNDFLHGRNNCGIDPASMDQMVWTCKLLHQLCCILLFKLSGFSGHIIDQTAFDAKIGSILNSPDGFRLI